MNIKTNGLLSGYRLKTLELFNWGTFHNKIWKITPNIQNSLLTGDIGSGKSTIVDAITTLLVPHHKIVYNAAAGAGNKERTLKSYVKGAYKNQQDQTLKTYKEVSLRPNGDTYTVLLAVFHNEFLNQQVSIAQVFWLQDEKVNKFFVVSELELHIKGDITGFGTDIRQLKHRLKRASNTSVYDTFKDYSSHFRQVFGIESERTLDLFYKTVSMKSVGNLTTFVQQQMLDKTDVKERIEELNKSFENLTQSYAEVQRARQQLELLQPIIKGAKEYDALKKKMEQLHKLFETLPAFFASKEQQLAEKAVAQAEMDLSIIKSDIHKLLETLQRLSNEERSLEKAIWENGGKRLNEIETQIEFQEKALKQKQKSAANYNENISALGLNFPEDVKSFLQNRDEIKSLQTFYVEQKDQIQIARDKLVIEKGQVKAKLDAEKQELTSLQKRNSQIPYKQVTIRDRIVEALDIDEKLLPFAGELIKVKQDASDWEGVIERVFHSFSLSMLVLEKHYERVSHYINNTDLKGKLVFYRVPENKSQLSDDLIPENSLCHKIDIKPDTPFETWLETTIEKRFNLSCASTINEFKKLPNAITKEGLIKQGRFRHEKDDRHRLFDRKYFVLGWSNEAKIKMLALAIKKNEDLLKKHESNKLKLSDKRLAIEELENSARELMRIEDFEQIDWQFVAQLIQELIQEKKQLENSNDVLMSLNNQLKLIQEDIKDKNNLKDEKNTEKGRIENRLNDYNERLRSIQTSLNTLSEEEKQEYFPLVQKLILKREITLENVRDIREITQNKILKKQKEKAANEKTLNKRLVGFIWNFNQKFPAETEEINNTVDAIPELKKLYNLLKEENLPAYEKKFKKMLHKGAINDILLFKTKLEEESKNITSKIDSINQSLKEIEYNTGTYIHIVQDKTKDAEIRDFQVELRECLKDTLGHEDMYNEEMYLKVKKVLDRFNSEESLDKNWRTKVTDVRQWFDFGASERIVETHEEVNFYSDSSGKSGGQKEKLAYTILASALAYQFGSGFNTRKSKSFGFVVIDEAFGKGSEESTRYGLKLFKQLQLQLVIVTPATKVNVIERFIRHVHFVSNRNDCNSEVRNMTIKEYQEEKQLYLGNERASA